MSQIVYFNGTRLVRPGGASKLDASSFEGVTVEGIGSIGIIGEADNGEDGVAIAFTNASAMEQYFGSGALANAARVAFRPLSDARVGDAKAQTVYAYKTNAGTAASLNLADGTSVVKLTAAKKGTIGNTYTALVSYDGTTKRRTYTITPNSSSGLRQERIVVNEGAKLKIWYKGAGTVPKVFTTADSTNIGWLQKITLNATTTPADQDKLEIAFDDGTISSIQDLATRINGSLNTAGTPVNVWGATVVSTSDALRFHPRTLDTIASPGPTVGTAEVSATDISGLLQDSLDAINNSLTLVTAALPASFTKRSVPVAFTEPLQLTGGALGTTAVGALQTALDRFKAIDVPGLVITSTDAASIKLLANHCTEMSSTGSSKKERTGYAGVTGSKAEILACAGQNAGCADLVLTCQKWHTVDRFANNVVYPEWASALALCSARAGLEPGEPLTWKFFSATDISSANTAWTPQGDAEDLILGGVCVFERNRSGVKLLKGITTYTQFDNDVFVEESIITNVKAMSKEFRELLELRYTGRKATPAILGDMRATAVEFWGQKRAQGRIVDSVVNGQTTKFAYRNLLISANRDQVFVDVEISPVSGINFQLETIRLVPATLSV
jgi:hypothetical protein